MLLAVGIIVFVVALLASIGLHELGHMIPAKKFGVKVTEYMIGFGPTLFSRKKGETSYGFKLFPLGGYVRMIGMFPPGKNTAGATKKEDGASEASVERNREAGDAGLGAKTSKTFFGEMVEQARAEDQKDIVTAEDERRAFYNLPPWKKIVVMFSGPATNLMIAVVLFGAIFTIFGTPDATTQVKTVSPCFIAGAPVGPAAELKKDAQGVCAEGSTETPADVAGVAAGDKIIRINNADTDTWDDFVSALRAAAPGENTVTVVRGGEEITLPVQFAEVPVAAGGGETKMFLGVTPEVALVRRPVTEVPAQFGGIIVQSVKGLVSFPAKIGGLAQTVVSDKERDPEGPIGVVGVSRVSGEVAAADVPASWKFVQILGLIASINLFLFLFNMLPILPLDGGHIAGALYEMAKRQVARMRRRPDPGPVDVARAIPFAYATTGVFILVSLLILYADIFKPIVLTK